MTREEFQQLCRTKIVFLDGATGTNLQKAGMPTGVCPEAWILEHPDTMMQLQRAYFEAGSDIVLAPTFTANRIKLDEYGLVDKIEEMNHQLVAISKEAAGDKGLVAGDMTMTGRQLAPMGDMGFEELVDIYKEQAGYLVDAGVDLFIVETMMSLNECRAALIAIREVTDLPVCVTLSFNEDGRTLFGTDASTAMVVLQSLGADAVGVNCSTGPEQMAELVREMKEYANIPIIAKPKNLPKKQSCFWKREPVLWAAAVVRRRSTSVHLRKRPGLILYRKSAKLTNVCWLLNVRLWKSRWMPDLRLLVRESIRQARRNCRQHFVKVRWIWSWTWL